MGISSFQFTVGRVEDGGDNGQPLRADLRAHTHPKTELYNLEVNA